VIMKLRRTFIQGSVLMMELRLCHPIWQHSVFSDPTYLSFKRKFNIIVWEWSSLLTLICLGSAANWSSGTRSAHTLLQQCVPVHSKFQTPILLQELFFCSSLIFAPSSPRHHFLTALSFFFPSTTTNERTNEQTNERTVTLLFSRHAHLLLTITNFLPFASLLLLLTLDRLRRWRRR
jgi:hypothetical protein